jgi:hypothetical protein
VLAEVLAEEGALARKKVVARRDIIVEVAPHLYGHDPALLDQVVARVIADPEMVPRIIVPGARGAGVVAGVGAGSGDGHRGQHRPRDGAHGWLGGVGGAVPAGR